MDKPIDIEESLSRSERYEKEGKIVVLAGVVMVCIGAEILFGWAGFLMVLGTFAFIAGMVMVKSALDMEYHATRLKDLESELESEKEMEAG